MQYSKNGTVMLSAKNIFFDLLDIFLFEKPKVEIQNNSSTKNISYRPFLLQHEINIANISYYCDT